MIILRIDNRTHLAPLSEVPGPLLDQIKGRLIFANPAFLEAQKRGFYAGNIPQEIIGYQVERTVRRLLREGRLPAKTDEAAGVILTDLDYYQSLVG